MICMDKLCGIVVLYLLLVINKCYLYFLFSVISTEYVLLGHGSMTFL